MYRKPLGKATRRILRENIFDIFEKLNFWVNIVVYHYYYHYFFLTRLMCTYVLLCLVFKVPPDLLCTDINECLYGYIKFRVTIFKKPFYDNDIYSFIFTKKNFSKI